MPPRKTGSAPFPSPKIVLLGESAVGKSSLVLRIIEPKAPFEEFTESTIGAAFRTQTIATENGTLVKLEIWDTAGQERYKSLAPMYYRNAHCAVVVYDVTNRESYNKAIWWIKELSLQANQNILIVLTGNKLDLAPKTPPELIKDIRDMANAYVEEVQKAGKRILFFETSAKDATNVQELFTGIAEILAKDVANAKKQHSANIVQTNKVQTQDNCAC